MTACVYYHKDSACQQIHNDNLMKTNRTVWLLGDKRQNINSWAPNFNEIADHELLCAEALGEVRRSSMGAYPYATKADINDKFTVERFVRERGSGNFPNGDVSDSTIYTWRTRNTIGLHTKSLVRFA